MDDNRKLARELFLAIEDTTESMPDDIDRISAYGEARYKAGIKMGVKAMCAHAAVKAIDIVSIKQYLRDNPNELQVIPTSRMENSAARLLEEK